MDFQKPINSKGFTLRVKRMFRLLIKMRNSIRIELRSIIRQLALHAQLTRIQILQIKRSLSNDHQAKEKNLNKSNNRLQNQTNKFPSQNELPLIPSKQSLNPVNFSVRAMLLLELITLKILRESIRQQVIMVTRLGIVQSQLDVIINKGTHLLP